MRTLILLALVSPVALGQSQSVGIVVPESVVVRGSPRVDGPDTGVVLRNTSVTVHHAEGEHWLAIQPPRGSVSWVNHKFIELAGDRFPQNAVVRADGQVRLAVGRLGTDRPLDVRMANIPDGTILVVTGPKMKSADDNSWWYPVIPPEDDFRYVPRESIRVDAPVKANFVVKSPEVAKPLESAAASLPAAKPTPNNATWKQAEEAERTGDTERAENLWLQLAREANAAGGDPDLANQCYARIHAIRERRRTTGTTAAKRDEPKRDEKRDEAKRDDRPRWTGSGSLRTTTFTVDGRTAYALENNRKQVLYYAVAGRGFDLAKFERRRVDLYGSVTYLEKLNGVGLVVVTDADGVK